MPIINGLVQRLRFYRNRGKFYHIYIKLQRLGAEPFVMPFWQDVNKKALKSFEPKPKWDFLSNRAIKDTMFVAGDQNWLDKQIAFLQKQVGAPLMRMATEDPAGDPWLLDSVPYKTSHNTLHHLYHIYFYLHKTKIKKSDLKTVVEWGGGYGNFAKLWKRHIDPEATYIIIDTTLFCSIQWLYLSTVLGMSQVHILDSPEATIQPGKINLVPLALMDNLDIKGDLFVSTWGLSESLNKAQDYVVERGWFDCPHLLLGFQNSTEDLEYASRLGKLAQKAGATILDIEFIPNNHYAFK